MDSFHVDIWVPVGTDRMVKVSPINDASGTGAAEFLAEVPLTPGSWNSVTLSKSDFTGMTWDAVKELKFDGQFNGDGSANTTPFDIYLDNIYFSQTPAPPVTAPTVSAPDPTEDPADVVSIFSDTYTDLPIANYDPNWGQSGHTQVNTMFDPTGAGTDFVLAYPNFNYQGTDFGSIEDLSGMDSFHVDIWVPAGTDRMVKVSPINDASGTGVAEFLVEVPLTGGSWNSVTLSKSDFTGMTWDAVKELKFDGQFNGDGSANTTPFDIYLDNIYFSQTPPPTSPTVSAPTPTEDPADVVSIYSDAYTDLPVADYNPYWGQLVDPQVNTMFDPTGGGTDFAMSYIDFSYQGTVIGSIEDLSGMDSFHVDIWVPVGTDRMVKVSPINDASGTGAAEFLAEVPLTPGSWNSVTLSKSDFTGMTWDAVKELKFDGQFNGDGSANTTPFDIYLDNIYFSQEPASGDCGFVGTFDYENDSTLESSLQGFTVDTPGDFITLSFTSGSTEAGFDDWFINDAADGTGNTIASGSGSIVGDYESTTGEISFYVISDFSVTGTTFEYEVTCAAPPSCPMPSDLTAENITTTSADLGWTENGTATVWDIEWGAEGFAPTGIPTDENVTNPYTLVSLSSVTSYDYYVRADCGSGDESTWAGPFTFMTECSVFVPDYLQDFTDMTPSETPICWEEADSGDPTTGPTDFGFSDWRNDGFLNNGSDGAARINLYNADTNSWLLSPEFDLSGGSYEVVFDIGITEFFGSDVSAMGSDDEVQFLYSEDGGTTWNNLQTWAAGSEPANAGETVSYDLSSITGVNVQFALWATEGTVDDTEDYNIYIDNFKVRTPPSCPEPVGVSVSEETHNSALVSWDEVTEAADGYEYVLITDGSTPGDSTIPTGSVADFSTISLTLENLDPETDYDVSVRSVCDANTQDYSAWSTAVSFTTGIMPTIVSAGNPITDSYCYVNNEFIEWRFDSDDDSPLVLVFSAGSVEEYASAGQTWDDLIIYDGVDDTGAVLYDSDEDGHILEGLSFTATSGSIYMTLESDGSINCDSSPNIDTIEFGVYVEGDQPDANVQIIHNSPDPAAASVDVYLNNILLPELTGVNFRTASAFESIPSLVDITVVVVPAGADISASVFTQTFNLDPGKSYIIVANGVLDPTGFITDNGFELSVFAGAKTTADDPTGVEVLVHHGSPDAPAVDVNEPDAGNLVSDIAYPQFQGYLPLAVDDYVLEIAAAGDLDALVAYSAPLTSLGLDGVAFTVIASGFLGDDAGPDNGFGLWVALPAGGALIPLDETLSTESFNDNNFNFYPNPTQDRLYLQTTGQVETVKVYNMLGQELISETPNSVSPSLKVGGLPTGTYIMNVTIDGTSANFRFIKK